MVWLLAAVSCRGATGLRLRLGPLLSSPLGPAAPLTPRLLFLLGPGPMHAQISLLRTGGGGGVSGNSGHNGGRRQESSGGVSSSSSSSLGSACPQDPKKTETSLTDSGVVDEKKQSKSQQLKTVFKEYGAVAVSLHIGISLLSLGIIYLIISSGMDVSSSLSLSLTPSQTGI